MRQVSLGVLICVIGTMMILDSADDANIYLPMTSGRYLLKCRASLDHTGNNSLEFSQGPSAGLFVLASVSEVNCLLIRPPFHIYVN